MRTVLLLLLFSVSCSAGGPIYKNKDRYTQLEFDNVYRDLAAARNRKNVSKTKAELQSLAPTYAGETFYCSDCTTDNLVISTGTTRGAWSRMGARSTTIN